MKTRQPESTRGDDPAAQPDSAARGQTHTDQTGLIRLLSIRDEWRRAWKQQFPKRLMILL